MMIKQMIASGKDDWKTPKDIYNALDKEFGFDFDPAPPNPQFDGLNVDWGNSNYINPPYSTKLQDAFIEKGFNEWKKGKTCVFLIPVRTSTKRWQNIILPHATEIRFTKRIKFEGAENVAPFDTAVVVFK